jgi:UDPglucose--hexose-1-phosphate uridylyltransferase
MQPLWEQRWHPLREEWILFTSHRGGRPWIGDKVTATTVPVPSYDPTCALCPGNSRLRDKRNPDYPGAYVFVNDLPCFGEQPVLPPAALSSLHQNRPALGTAEVICYHPDHSKTMAHLTQAEVLSVVELWTERYRELGQRPEVNHVLIFENKGAAVGTSNPHPHGQIYASNMIYGHTSREIESGRRYFTETGVPLGQALLALEMDSPREIVRNDHFIVCVPWFARYAYETYVWPRRPMASLLDLTAAERASLAAILRELTIRYDNLWQLPMPYVMAIHQAPTDGQNYGWFPFHFEFHPPLRKPDTLKYLAGPEIGGGSMTNESNPDEKAAELRATSALHYLHP